ncbi:MAG TPA: hypothetical protein VGO58_10840 [Chitinophagaceae bacterium]|jgi:hypothetical protein|nr:hypothetical protein [Chitinophagaceae bacterium]
MKFSVKQASLLLIVFLASNKIVYSQGGGLADTTKLEKKISILNGKVFFDFPTGAINSPRVADIMAADPNVNKETRVIVDNGSIRLVFFAQELYVFGNNLFGEISKENEQEYDFQRKILSENDSVQAILSTPTRFDSTAAAILVNSLLVRSPDNTVSRIDVYINPDGWALRGEYARLTENVFKTMTKGNRRINFNAKEETYTIFGTSSKFIFKLPKNYFVTVDEKYDFGVFKINKFRNSLTDTTYTSLVVYTGHHPTYFHKEYGYTEDKATKLKGLFLQAPVDWLYFKDDAQHFYLKEQFVPSDTIETGLILHVAMLSNKKEVVEELAKIVEAIKVVK